MRDIAAVLLRAVVRGLPAPEEDGPWSERAARRPAGDWCQTPPGGDSIGRLSAHPDAKAAARAGRRTC